MPPFPPYTRIGSFAVQVAQPNVSTSPLPSDESSQRTAYLSSSLTSVIACLTPMLALMYCCALFWTYRYAQRYPRPLNKTSGLRLQRYAPRMYRSIEYSLFGSSVLIYIFLQRGLCVFGFYQLGRGNKKRTRFLCEPHPHISLDLSRELVAHTIPIPSKLSQCRSLHWDQAAFASRIHPLLNENKYI